MILVTALWIAPEPISSQRLLIDKLTIEDGLPSSSILDLDLDPSGRLWVLTRVGLALYDGKKLEIYSADDGLPSAQMSALEVDATGSVWVAAGRGPTLYRRSEGRWSPLPSTPSMSGSDAPVFLETLEGKHGVLAVAGNGEDGLWLWNQDRDGTYPAPERPVFTSDRPRIRALVPFEDGLAIGTDRGLCFLEFDGAVDCLDQRLPRLATSIHALFPESREDGPDRLWILAERGRSRSDGLTSAGLVYLQKEELKLEVVVKQLPPLSLEPRGWATFKTLMLKDAGGGLLIGNTAAVYHLDSSLRLSTLAPRNGLEHTGITSLILDREANVWAGSPRGLSRIAPQRFLTLDQSQGLMEDEVTGVLEIAPDRFIFTHNLGLSFLDGQEITTLPFDRTQGSARNDFRVLDLEVDRDGDVWLATVNMGLLRLDRRRRITRELSQLEVTRSVERDPEGRLWVLGTGGLFEHKENGFVRRHNPEGIHLARWLKFTPSGDILITTIDGLLVLRKGETWQHLHGEVEGHNSLFGILVDSAGKIWLGSAAGPVQLQGNRLVSVPGTEFVAPVFFIFEDPKARIWFGTDNGVRIWDGTELRHLTSRHGLSGLESNRGAGIVDHRGRAWIGTHRGVSVYQEAYDRTLPAPRVEHVGIAIEGEAQSVDLLDQKLELEYDQNDLSFRFQTIAFAKEETLQVSYRLEGLDSRFKAPTDIPTSEVRYSSLAPGTYRFRVKGRWVGGPWSDEAVSPLVVIASPFWQTYPFYAAMALLIVGAATGLHNLRIRAVRAKAHRLEVLNRTLQEAAEERQRLIESLESQNVELERFNFTVSHDLKSPLVTIRGFIGCIRGAIAAGQYEDLDEDLARVDDAAGKMGRLLEELLELARLGRVVNPSEIVSLAMLTDEVVDLCRAEIEENSILIEIAPDLPKIFGDRLRLRMVLLNLVENAIKFTRGQASPKIEIEARDHETRTLILVRDNGTGIEPDHLEQIFGLFKRLDPSVPGTGVGLALVKRIVEAHHGEVWAESEGTGCGSRFIVALPRPN